jgi:hypothetical protein
MAAPTNATVTAINETQTIASHLKRVFAARDLPPTRPARAGQPGSYAESARFPRLSWSVDFLVLGGENRRPFAGRDRRYPAYGSFSCIAVGRKRKSNATKMSERVRSVKFLEPLNSCVMWPLVLPKRSASSERVTPRSFISSTIISVTSRIKCSCSSSGSLDKQLFLAPMRCCSLCLAWIHRGWIGFCVGLSVKGVL